VGVRLDQKPIPLLHRTRLRNRGPVTVPGGNEPYFRAVSEMGTNIDPKRLAEINA